MTRLVPIPHEGVQRLSKHEKKEWGYQFVSVALKDGRRFDPAVASEGYIVEVKGHMDVPFAAEDVKSVAVTRKHWNFRRERLDKLRNLPETERQSAIEAQSRREK